MNPANKAFSPEFATKSSALYKAFDAVILEQRPPAEAVFTASMFLFLESARQMGATQEQMLASLAIGKATLSSQKTQPDQGVK